MKDIIRQNLDTMQRSLKETGHYRIEGPKWLRAMPSFLATPLFSLHMGNIFWNGWREASRPNYAADWWDYSSYRVIQSIVRMGGSVEYEGFEHMKELNGGTAVLAANHTSSIETYLIPPAFIPWHNVAYVLKEQLRSYPFMGRLVRAVDPIPVTRKSPVEDLRQVLTHGKKALLEESRFVMMFPQGSRFRLFDPKRYNTLATKLAKHAHSPVLPICVTADFYRIGEWQRDLFATCHPTSPVRIALGSPISPDLSPADMQQLQLDFIDQTLARWEDLDHRFMRVSSAKQIASR